MNINNLVARKCLGCIILAIYKTANSRPISTIECEGWRQHSSLIFLILLFTKPNIEVSGWLFQTKTHFTHILYQPFSRVSPPSFTLYENETGYFYVADRLINGQLSQVGGTSAQLYF